MSRRPLQWVELAPSYHCNNACVGCFANSPDPGPGMGDTAILEALTRGRRDGATALWIGGGEPTLARGTLRLAQAARRLGYARVKLQTNGMMLAYPAYAQRCRDAGITEVAFSVKGANEATHDRLTRTAGCFALMVQGMAHAREVGLALEADLLAYRTNLDELPTMVRDAFDRGATRVRVWALSAADLAHDPAVRAEVPRLTALAAALARACEALPPDAPPDALVSLHNPPCTLPLAHRERLRFFAPELALRIEDPSGRGFMLEDSPLEGGAFLPACATCAERPRCNGPRRDYRAIHGDAEFIPR